MKDTLIIYYSYTGNSKKVAEYAQNKLNTDILELSPVIPFSDNYDQVVEEWQNNHIKRDVSINPINIDLSTYSKIILITGTWWYGITPVMKKFLKENNLRNKQVLVAATNAGWIGHSLKDYETLISGNILGRLDIVFKEDSNGKVIMDTPQSEIDAWLEKL